TDVRASRLFERREPDGHAETRRLVDRNENPHVRQALPPGGLRFLAFQNAVRKVGDLRGELVASGEAAMVRLSLDGQVMLELDVVLEGGLDAQMAQRAHGAVLRHPGGALADRKLRGSAVGEV